MAYVLDVRKRDSQEGISIDTLLKLDRKTLAAIKTLNSEIAEELSYVFLKDLGNVNFPKLMYSSMIRMKKLKPARWEINVWAAMHQTRSLLYGVSMAADAPRLEVVEPDPESQRECTVCSGRGRMAKISKPGQPVGPANTWPDAISTVRLRQRLAPPIIACHQLVAETIDAMRGRGDFDDMLRSIEARLRSMRRSVFHYEISVEARVVSGSRPIQVRLGRIALSPQLYVRNSMPASSLWEARKLTGEKFPVQLTYFEACPVCLGLGISNRSSH